MSFPTSEALTRVRRAFIIPESHYNALFCLSVGDELTAHVCNDFGLFSLRRVRGMSKRGGPEVTRP